MKNINEEKQKDKVQIPRHKRVFYRKCNLDKHDWEAIKDYYRWIQQTK